MQKKHKMKSIHIIVLSFILLISCGEVQSEAQKEKVSENPQKVRELLVNDTLFSFEEYTENKIPAGWTQCITGRGSGTDWAILNDKGNKVLAQLSSENPNYHFNDIVYDGFIVKNVELKVSMKGVDGRMDQGGGFIWRFTDRNNYYVVRANPLEDNVVLYKVVNGKRTDLPLKGQGRTYGVNVKPLGNDWNELKLTVKDNLFTVYLNDKEIFQVEDDTFIDAGKIGLWTKADAVSYFDNFTVKAL